MSEGEQERISPEQGDQDLAGLSSCEMMGPEEE